MNVPPVQTPDPPTSLRQADGEHRRSCVASALFLLILLIAGLLRFHDLTFHSLWSDELFTIESSAGHGLEHLYLTDSGLHDPPPDLVSLRNAGPWWKVATSLARDDNHPPLYFLVVRVWRHAFGDSAFALRSLSVVFSLAAIALLYVAAKELHGRSVATWAAAIMAVAGPQVQFAQEARAYAMLLMLGCGACAAVALIERRGSSIWRSAALGACVLGLMLTHYYAIVPCAAIGLYVLIRLRGRARWTAVTALVAAAACFIILWGPQALRQRDNLAGNNFWVIESPEGHLAKTAMRLALTPMRYLFEPMRRAEPAASIGASLYLIPLLMLRRRPDLLLWALWLPAAVALPLLTDLRSTSRQLEFLRYTVLTAPAVYVLLPALLRDVRQRWLAHALPALGVVACLISLPQAYAEPLTPKPDWRVSAELIDRLAGPSDVMLFYGEWRNFTGSHYLALQHYSKRLPRTAIFTSKPLDAATLDRLRRSSGVWTVVIFEVSLPEDFLPGFTAGPRAFLWGLPSVQYWSPPATSSTQASTAPTAARPASPSPASAPESGPAPRAN